MLPPNLATPREVTLYYDGVYDTLTSPAGGYVPFLYPWAGLGAFLVIGYLLIDHRQNFLLTWLRFPIAATLVAFQSWCIVTNKARHPAAAFGVGLLSAWGIMWVSTVMVVNDCQTDFRRIERTDGEQGGERADEQKMNGSAAVTSKPESISRSTKSDEKSTATLYWQSYPIAPFATRLNWIADVFCSFRGVGWTFQSSIIPPLPAPLDLRVPETISHTTDASRTVSRVGIRRLRNRQELLPKIVRNLIIGYLALDLIKVLMHHDAYFWGYMNAAPPTYLPLYIKKSATAVRSWRLLISLAGIYTALWEIFRLGPVFFACILGPKWLGVRGEAWMNPADMYGSFTCVLNDGLAGWWGGWWHQVFRVAFEEHSKALLRVLKMEPKSQTGRLLSLSVAFFMSGCLHACGSYTQLGDTRPLTGPMRFFLLQGLGIVVQMVTVGQLKKAGVLERTPKLGKQMANLVFVLGWLYYTAPLLVDDFAKGGVWLFEPIVVSPLRALGFGAKDDSWFCWWDGIVFWRSGTTWWNTGIAV